MVLRMLAKRFLRNVGTNLLQQVQCAMIFVCLSAKNKSDCSCSEYMTSPKAFHLLIPSAGVRYMLSF